MASRIPSRLQREQGQRWDVQQSETRDTSATSRDHGCTAPPSPPTLDDLRRLAAKLQGITAAHGALGLQVFGSVVHGSAGPGSALDLLVEFPATPSFEQFPWIW
jgi:hypothetical protein